MNKSTLSLLAAATLLLGAATGCNPPDNGTTTTTTSNSTNSTMSSTSTPAPGVSVTTTTTTTTTSSSPAMAGSPGTSAPAGTTTLDASNGTTVQINLSDSAVQMPSALPAGSMLFVVNNNGKAKHNLEIKGGDVDKKLDAPVDPGASQSLKVDLKAGTYVVTDPDNAALKATLTIKS